MAFIMSLICRKTKPGALMGLYITSESKRFCSSLFCGLKRLAISYAPTERATLSAMAAV